MTKLILLIVVVVAVKWVVWPMLTSNTWKAKRKAAGWDTDHTKSWRKQ